MASSSWIIYSCFQLVNLPQRKGIKETFVEVGEGFYKLELPSLFLPFSALKSLRLERAKVEDLYILNVANIAKIGRKVTLKSKKN